MRLLYLQSASRITAVVIGATQDDDAWCIGSTPAWH